MRLWPASSLRIKTTAANAMPPSINLPGSMDEALKAAIEAVLLAAALLDTRAAMSSDEDDGLFWIEEANKLRDTATRLLPPADEWPKAKGDMGQLYDFKSRQRVN